MMAAEQKGRGRRAEELEGEEVPGLPKFPTAPDVCWTPQLFCCRRYKEAFDDVIQELMRKDEEEEELDVTPHADPTQAELRSSIKDKLLQQ